MRPRVVAALPIKPFGVAKARLAPVLGPTQRSRLGRAVAARTAATSKDAGADVLVVTSDEGVTSWAKEHDLGVLREDPALGPGLDGAARTAARHIGRLGLTWVIVHADLPVATVDDLGIVFAAATAGPVIVPSHDGGTNVIGGTEVGFRFAYGTGSFHRHLAVIPAATVISLPRLALDLDTPRDLALALRSPEGAWMAPLVGGPDALARW